MLGYNEICSMVQNGWQEHYNETQEVAYATNGNQFVGYDNVRSIKKKLDFLLSRKLGGAMIWSIDTDVRIFQYILKYFYLIFNLGLFWPLRSWKISIA